jgi:flagellar biogenesis protein FliO
MEPMQQATAVLLVLVLFAGTLYALRGKGLQMVFSRRVAGGNQRLLQSLERLPLTPQHSLHLVRVDGRTILVAVSPNGCSILDQTSAESTWENGGLVR